MWLRANKRKFFSLSGQWNIKRVHLCTTAMMRGETCAANPHQLRTPNLVNFFALTQEELANKMKPFPPYRSRQVWDWVYDKGVVDFSAMVNLPQELRHNLEQYFVFGDLALEMEQVSRQDDTIKRAYKLADGQLIESVLMAYDDGRRTACISSQAGCAMGCVFCATGQMVCILCNRNSVT